jgi:hypothetical protein
MAFKFSVWLRETARLYLRYMVVGLVGIPLALVFAIAARTGWNVRVMLPLLVVCGFAAVAWVWRRMGDWQIKPQVVVSPFEASWADLLKATSENLCIVQYKTNPIIDEDQLLKYQDLLDTSLLLSSTQVTMVQQALHRTAQTTTETQPTKDDEILQQMLLSRLGRQIRTAQPAPSFRTGSRVFSPQPLTAGVHG